MIVIKELKKNGKIFHGGGKRSDIVKVSRKTPETSAMDVNKSILKLTWEDPR